MSAQAESQGAKRRFSIARNGYHASFCQEEGVHKSGGYSTLPLICTINCTKVVHLMAPF